MVDLPLLHTGKVRRLYRWSDDQILMVATDAISAFDFVLDTPIPDKGIVLTQLSQWWFNQIDFPNHVVSVEVPEEFAGRGVIVESLDMVPVECIARGYLTGSGWKEYQVSRTVCGIPLPEGLVDGSKLPEPIFTPSTKAEIGEHDENVDYATIVASQGADLAARLRDATLQIYTQAADLAAERGIILADTKFEFGELDGEIILIDEALTPDSSRFWDAAHYKVGSSPESFDKQFVRDWLEKESGWDKKSAPPALPEKVVEGTVARYREALDKLARG